MNILDSSDHEIAILDNIHRQAEKKPVRQRDLSRVVGISLGMTNVILRKLAQRGWLKIRKVNNRNVHYAVTPAGLEEIARRSFKFLKRTVRNVVYFKDVLEAFVQEAQERGCAGVVLDGRSDFDFILAHVCQKRGVAFTQDRQEGLQKGYLIVHGEDVRSRAREDGSPVVSSGEAYLHEILMKP